ncbi:MAG: LuxR C-terminal-related transcriptional regulator [Butyrivibrio sp.]|nr:LuxR C-terminal-related transcriptional regulator [Butyrivibrio sp.]
MNKDGKNSTGIAYITDRLFDKFKRMRDFGVTIMNAPAGFGKTAALKEYSHGSNDKFCWINISGGMREIFWSDLCEIFEGLDAEAGSGLRKLGFPQSEKNFAELRSIIKKAEVSYPTFIVTANCHLIDGGFLELFANTVSEILPGNLHFIFTTQEYRHSEIIDISESDAILYIGKEDMQLSAKDIVEYFRQHGIKLSRENAAKLYEYSEGWLSAIYLQMINYTETGGFDNNASIDAMVEKTVWEKLDSPLRRFLITLSRLKSFTLREAMIAAPDGKSEAETEKFLGALDFVRFDKSKRSYFIHNVFMDYLNKEFLLLESGEKKEMIIKAGSVYELRGDIFTAYKHYYAAGAWERIYSSLPSFDEFYPYINDDNRDFFISLVSDCPDSVKDNYVYFSAIMCLVLFMYNEREYLAENLMSTLYSIENMQGLTQRQKRNLLCTFYYVRGYTEYSSILMMHGFYRKALEYAGSAAVTVAAKVPFTFGCPSVLHIFHREDKSPDEEVNYIDGMMTDYYKLSGGHGKGAEALFRAEVLFNRGDFEGSRILCHKALYMSDSKEQTCITLGALLLLARISIFDGDGEAYAENTDSFRKKVKYGSSALDGEYANMVDMSEAFMYALTDEGGKIAEWLTDSIAIQNRVNLICVSYANIIYSKYLYINREYQKFLGISGQLLNTASLFSCAMPKIYTYIFIAMCNKELGNRRKAEKMLGEAMYIAKRDGFIMPFAENAAYLEELLDDSVLGAEYRDFIKQIKSVAKKYLQGARSISRNARSRDNFGLTARELDVARLAAERYSNREIGEMLYIAESTVKSNLKVIFSKLNINSRSELTQFFK